MSRVIMGPPSGGNQRPYMSGPGANRPSNNPLPAPPGMGGNGFGGLVALPPNAGAGVGPMSMPPAAVVLVLVEKV